MTGYLTANEQPGEHPKSWYVETAGPFPDLPALNGNAKADLCIIGGGYAGLSAALHAAEAGMDVRWHISRGVGHGIDEEGLTLAAHFLRDVLL